MSIITLTNISKEYGNEDVLSGVNLSVEKGEMIAILGESGKGKTTLLNIIGLITKSTEGDLTLWDKKNPPIHSKDAMHLRRSKIGYLFQNYGLVEDEKVDWNLNLALTYKKMNKKDKEKKIDFFLKEFGLLDLKEKYIYQLSGGEQQRIALIRLILQESELILADEPTASLDEQNEYLIMNYLKRLNEEGCTIIVVTHNKKLLNYFSRVINLSEI